LVGNYPLSTHADTKRGGKMVKCKEVKKVMMLYLQVK